MEPVRSVLDATNPEDRRGNTPSTTTLKFAYQSIGMATNPNMTAIKTPMRAGHSMFHVNDSIVKCDPEMPPATTRTSPSGGTATTPSESEEGAGGQKTLGGDFVVDNSGGKDGDSQRVARGRRGRQCTPGRRKRRRPPWGRAVQDSSQWDGVPCERRQEHEGSR